MIPGMMDEYTADGFAEQQELIEDLYDKVEKLTKALDRLTEYVAELESQNVKHNYPGDFTSKSEVMQDVKDDIWEILNK